MEPEMAFVLELGKWNFQFSSTRFFAPHHRSTRVKTNEFGNVHRNNNEIDDTPHRQMGDRSRHDQLQIRRAHTGWCMIAISPDQLLEQVRAAQSAYHRLVIIAGLSGSGKTRLLNQVATQLNLPIINLSLLLSQHLLGLTRRQRALNAGEIAIELIDEHFQSGLCLDNTEILFDSTLHLNPLVFLQEISRNRLIIASWNGPLDAGELRFGYASHPDFFSQAVTGYPVVTASEEKLQLYLTT